MTNHRLRGAMLNAEMTAEALACAVGVDGKSVARWIAEGRVPHPRTRQHVARLLHQHETFLWPVLLATATGQAIAESEIDRTWPTRSAIPAELWHQLFSHATTEIDILVYAGGFLIETLDLADILRWKAQHGTKMRVLVGDPDSDAVAVRSVEEQLPWLGDRCRTTRSYLKDAARCPRIDVKSHGTTLYASHFRFDDVLLVNTHSFGAWACQSPVHKICRVGSGYLFDHYCAAYERVWRLAS